MIEVYKILSGKYDEQIVPNLAKGETVATLSNSRPSVLSTTCGSSHSHPGLLICGIPYQPTLYVQILQTVLKIDYIATGGTRQMYFNF